MTGVDYFILFCLHLDNGIIMDIPTELELVWKPKMITRLIEDGQIYVSGMWI